MCEHVAMKNPLETYRISSGMTYRKIAELCGLKSPSTVLQHCKGARSISAETAIKYSIFLGIPLSELRPDLWPPTSAAPTSTPGAADDGRQ